jgi:hypothetical protein
MEELGEYERVEVEYHRVCEEYNAATEEMLALAADAEKDVSEFKWVSDRVSRLSEKLARLRAAMTLLHGQRGQYKPPPCDAP